MKTSCGVIVTDGSRLLLGRTTGTRRWDIPKGGLEEGETFLEAAVRELREETSLAADPAALTEIGILQYLRAKQLALFIWRPQTMPDPAALFCETVFTRSNGSTSPEFDAYGLYGWDQARTLAGRGLARILPDIRLKVQKLAEPPRPRKKYRGLQKKSLLAQ